jgi:cell wall-associated NlpC family hydrolase
MYEKYVGIKWVKGGSSLSTGADCWGIVTIAIKELFGIEIKDCLGCKAEGDELHQVIINETSKYKLVSKPQPAAIIVMYNNNKAEHVGLCLDKTNVLHSIKTSSSINTVSVLKRAFSKLEFYQCQTS